MYDENKKVGEVIYHPKDKKSKGAVIQGLAETHEQATDAYTEGTVGGDIHNSDA
ncbi:YozQ family protein [Virgibacillus soli]|uniref:YozQ family protein n=1 Tax=Paracerasibacillus soli TaxID=480284 RepID=A0ABU5CVT8_9BACI|nr:YozQ family protein [Virgibacillus soli]MDY0409932.1 YozQ family protein [Virgibacillus soli]